MKSKRFIIFAIAGAIALLALLSLRSCGDNTDSGPARTLPASFDVKQRVFFKWTETFDVSGDGVNYGTVSQKLVSFTKSFNYDDNTGARTATASVAVLSWGTQIDVVDGAGKRIGTIKQELFTSPFKTWTTYRILDGDGNQVATSQKSEFWSTSFDLTANDGHLIATIHRNAWNWMGDNWSVTVKDSAAVDPRIEVMIAAFKTSADEEQKAKEAEKKKSSDSSNKSSGSKK
jgi:uncharacterized protein YxjI